MIIFYIKFASAILVGLSSIAGLIAGYRKYQTWKKRLEIAGNELAKSFVVQFNKQELEGFLSGYVIPKCAPADPTHKDGEEYMAEIRQSLFEYMDSNVTKMQRSYHLLLADTGMGKTTFCLNYYTHVRKRFPQIKVSLVSLASKHCDFLIASIVDKSATVLILDALDEDPKALSRGKDRLYEILEIASDFKSVIITCRSQFFTNDDSIPRETPLPITIPRRLGQSPMASLVRSYISPFSTAEVDRYITKHFPLYFFWRYPGRKRAQTLVSRVPDLANRPMLLERLPELANGPTKSNELYDLYALLVDGWLQRESRWIPTEKLRSVSLALAVHMFNNNQIKQGRLNPEEIERFAEDRFGKSPEWRHLTSRSLLNRDSGGNYKFAHKSIMEFLVVQAASDGVVDAINQPWTAFMKEVFVSWGHSHSGYSNFKQAQEILESSLGRTNVAPLFDMHSMMPVRGIPNFLTVCERKKTSSGERLSPQSWRSCSIDISKDDHKSQYTIHDREYNLTWLYVPNSELNDLEPLTLLEMSKFAPNRPGVRLPSFEQFVTLAEGLSWAGSDLLSPGTTFLLGDKPGRTQYLLVQIDAGKQTLADSRTLERRRKIDGTDIYLNCYLADLTRSRGIDGRVKVDQLFIIDAQGSLF